jgi:hypothetical protein
MKDDYALPGYAALHQRNIIEWRLDDRMWKLEVDEKGGWGLDRKKSCNVKVFWGLLRHNQPRNDKMSTRGGSRTAPTELLKGSGYPLHSLREFRGTSLSI